MENVLGSMVLHCRFPVSKCVEVYLENSWIAKLLSSILSLSVEAVCNEVPKIVPRSLGNLFNIALSLSETLTDFLNIKGARRKTRKD
jgi:hypothetical protein